ncbi:MAG: 30S ribosomal protein S1 [Phototrophicales bacterium]|nr:MAG: 30S ribosomal protein S1 [Phototrophicales bacterium]RMG74988.1 MAG: S1 RNA-binding domain-containing protein [Chloroflexota bacterium]
MGTPNADNQIDMDEISEFERLLNEEPSFSPTVPRKGEIRTAVILEIREREIIVDLNAKQDGIVRSEDLERLDDEYRQSLRVGDEVPVYVLHPRDQDDNLIVSINMGLQRYDWDLARKLLETEDVDTVRVTGHNRGGILVRWRRLEGFIPSSHLISAAYSGDRRDAWNDLIGSELTVKVIEVDQDRRRLIFSEREAQKEQRAQQKARLLSELKEGDVVQGIVTGLRDFGAFVNLGGADGLIHVSELAWHRVDHPRDVLNVGDEIDVYVLNLDRETNRIALSRKRLLRDPWEDAAERYHEGQLVEGTVTNVVDFGAFVALDNGLEGLLHLSEMGDGTLKEPHSYVKKGDRLSLRISHLEPEKRRVGFTQRWGTNEADDSSSDTDEQTTDEQTNDADEPTEDEAIE